MNGLEAELRRAVAELAALGCRFALVGGLAVSARVEPRLTRDADLAVSVDSDAQAEGVLARLRSRGYVVVGLVEHEGTGRLATARLSGDPEGGAVLDLLFASTGIEPEIVDEAEALEVLAGLTVPVATVGHLIAMKLLARDDRRRPADADDLAGLAGQATDADWADAARAVGLIAERGFARDRDLHRSLRILMEQGAY